MEKQTIQVNYFAAYNELSIYIYILLTFYLTRKNPIKMNNLFLRESWSRQWDQLIQSINRQQNNADYLKHLQVTDQMSKPWSKS